ncbi:hypothetical protein K470DRAFT_4886 [Piedraia hortae CBS 480.64]|uniref:Uncharacterized protein n=1 Tax=Piedraia hortae CBS 480.64 TaxID=1314780 RepID=A0A6A7CDR8_9PEZI|nr:hypothetical protein K470DRAFT_4886 [Piedraia hortae CBS 480.64]
MSPNESPKLPTESALAPFNAEERDLMALSYFFAKEMPDLNVNAIAHFKRKRVCDVRRAWESLRDRIIAQKDAIERETQDKKQAAKVLRAEKKEAKRLEADMKKQQGGEEEKEKEVGTVSGDENATPNATPQTQTIVTGGESAVKKGKKRASDAHVGWSNKKIKLEE